MVDVKSKRCASSDCAQPSFNCENDTNGMYCSKHKQDGMVDVKSKRCKSSNCQIRPTFGYPGYAAICCKQHIENDMISNPYRLYVQSQCREIALYGVGKAWHCVVHKHALDINLVECICIGCNILNILDEHMKFYTCDPNIMNNVGLAKQTRVKR